MGWFDEQIRQRKEKDQEVFEESIFRMASIVLGKSKAGIAESGRFITKEAIDEILKYYHYKPAEIPDSVKDPDEQLEFCLRPHGLMRRNVKLDKGWYKDAFGPMLAFTRDGGIPVALLAASNPLGTIASALFVSYIQVGGDAMQPEFAKEIIDIIIAAIIYLSAFSLLIREMISRNALKKARSEAEGKGKEGGRQ